MSRFSETNIQRALDLVGLYPQRRSATIPLCHLAQEQDGYLSEDAMRHIAELTGTTPAEVHGTATFYDMLHTEPVGRYVVGICTNIACLLQGASELLEEAVDVFGSEVGTTSPDGRFTLEELECVAHCDRAPCATVNYRYFGPLDREGLVALRNDLLAGELDRMVPPHGTLNRVARVAPQLIPMDEIDAERYEQDRAREERERSAADTKEVSQ